MFSIVSKISHVPIQSRTAYVVDIDNTLIISKTEAGQPRKFKLHDRQALLWFERVRQKCPHNDIVYLTKRPEKGKELTELELKTLGLPLFPILFCIDDKGLRYLEYCYFSKKNPQRLIFIDDMIENLIDFLNVFPTADCYKIDFENNINEFV